MENNYTIIHLGKVDSNILTNEYSVRVNSKLVKFMYSWEQVHTYMDNSFKECVPNCNDDILNYIIDDFRKIFNDTRFRIDLNGVSSYDLILSGDTLSNAKLCLVLFKEGEVIYSTSMIKEALTPNIFLTNNSLYFLIDPTYKLKMGRDIKLNKLI